MANPENLKPFKKGEDPRRNLKGRPEGTLNAKTIIKKWLEAKTKHVNPITQTEEELTQYDIMALQQIAKARKGDTKAFEAVLDRVEGKPKQELDINQDITWVEEKTYEADKKADKSS